MNKILSIVVVVASLFGNIGISNALTVLEKQRDVNDTLSQETISNTYYDAIRWGYEAGVFDGYKDGTNAGKFIPDGTITRAEFLKMLFNVTKEAIGSEYNTNCFKDSTTDKWYNKYLCYSKAKKYLGGHSDGTFHPNDNILVSEAFKILVNTFGIQENTTDDAKYAYSFRDMPQEGKWYYQYASIIIKNGIRYSEEYDDLSRYEKKLTRGEMMNLLYQFYAVGISKEITSDFLTNWKNKDSKAMFNTLDKKSQDIEVDATRYNRIISETPIFIQSIKYKGGIFSNGTSSTVYKYVDSQNEKYTRKAVANYYTISFKLGSNSSSDTITRDVILMTTIDNGSWAIHIDKNRFFDTQFVGSDSSIDSCGNAKGYGFLGYMLIQNTKDNRCYNRVSEINNIHSINGSYYYLFDNSVLFESVGQKMNYNNNFQIQ